MSLLFILLHTLLCMVSTTGISPCPIQYDIGSVFSAQVTISNYNGRIPLIQNEDVQCYNYSLPYKFGRIPEVAISSHIIIGGFHEIESEITYDLYFALKPIQSDSFTSIPFIIRTQWRYTRWKKIAFSFLAQDRRQLQSGYYQIDTGALGGCQSTRQINVLVPFKQTFTQNIKYSLFLHGFQISTQKSSPQSTSPFEIHVTKSAVNCSGISLLFTLNTITKIHAIHISYVAYVQTTLNIVQGEYAYNSGTRKIIEHIPLKNVGRNYARIHGFTGFVINHRNQGFRLFAQWTGTKFIFDLGLSQHLTHYLNYHYIFFIGSECSDCPGYPLTFEGKCVNICPLNYFATSEKLCLTCGDGQKWNGTGCQKSCPVGQYLNLATNKCECPSGLHWNGRVCFSCSSGKVFNPKAKKCQCPEGLKWNGYGCANVPQCKNGKQWNIYTYSCDCPLGSKWNGTYCVGIKTCYNGKILNKKFQCVCPEGTYWNEKWCQNTGCTGGQVWKGNKCICSSGLYFNGTLCIQCINGQKWDERSKSCKCEKGYKWNGNYCQKFQICSGGRIYNSTFEQCVCKDGYFWNGFACMIQPECCCGQIWNDKEFQCNCPESFNWDGSLCIQCINGKVWNEKTLKCDCLSGTQWNGEFCFVIQTCVNGMIWNQNTWTCECPSTTVWNGKYCISNPCIGGKIWDNYKKACFCPAKKIFYHGKCVPPKTKCKDGKIWDPTIYGCRCPNGYWNNGTSCLKKQNCKSNQLFNPFLGRCQCRSGFVWLESKNSCADPTCPVGKRWDGKGCIPILCPPNSFYNGSECICPTPRDKCKPWEYYDGEKCVYFPEKCPLGTIWNKTACVPLQSGCPLGFYGSKDNCQPIPQQCAPNTFWNPLQKKCKPKGNQCPKGTYFVGGSCQPFSPCQNGKVWDPKRFFCLCPKNSEWNGNSCIPCSGGKIWQIGSGCECPQGSFFSGSSCNPVNNERCQNIPNSVWKNGKCICKPGFSVVGIQCICDGIVIDGFCQRCAHIPNSKWKYGRCLCEPGYTLENGYCQKNTPGNDDPSSCSVGTYFDSQQRRCLACSDGCLSCESCYTCLQCRVQFNYDSESQLCLEQCGDGKKFILQCDDGNNDDGDGCSVDCKIEPGYSCVGGSPNSADTCIVHVPQSVELTQTGQILYEKKVILNIKLDYFPQNLLQSKDCNDRCSSVLLGQIVNGDNGAIAIRSTFIPGSSYSFSIQINFGRSFIGKFTIQIKINPALAKYFESVGIGRKLEVNVNPAYLSQVKEDIID